MLLTSILRKMLKKKLQSLLTLYLITLKLFLHSSQNDQLSLKEAISETLGYQWNIFISEMQVKESEGRYQTSKGPFDPTLRLRATQGWGDTWSRQLGIELGDGDIFEGIPGIGTVKTRQPGGIQVNTLNTTVSGSFEKRTRFGTVMSVEASVEREKNPFFILNDIYSIDQFSYIRDATANVTVRVQQPFLKGFLNSLETVTERSQKYMVDSSKLLMIHEMSEQILETVDAYWDLVKAHKLVHAYKTAVNDHQQIVDDVQALIDKHQVAKTEISQALRDLLTAKTNLEESKQSVVAQAQRLSFSMGNPEEYLRYCNMNIKLDDFPIREIQDLLSCTKMVKPATFFALSHRNDLQALDCISKAAGVEVKGAFNQSLPSLNLELMGKKTNQAYGGDARSVFSAFAMPAPQRELSVGLSLVFPIFRDRGRGEYKTAKAQKRQADLQYQRLRSKIITSVIEAINTHNYLIKQILDVTQGLCEAKVYVHQQNTLYKAGFTSLFEYLESVNKMVFQNVRKVEIEAAYFKNIAKIHYLLGIMVKSDRSGKEFEVFDVVKLPEDIWTQVYKTERNK